MSKRTSSRFAVVAGWVVLAGAGLLGTVTPAFATDGCITPPSGLDDGVGVCDITTSVVQIVPPPGEGTPSVAFSNSTQTNYVKYRVTLTHYAVRNEGFSQVKFVADTSVVNASSPGPANFFAASAATIANAGAAVLTNPATACVISTTHIECAFNFSPAFDNPPLNSAQATITFDVTVQSPTGTPAVESQPNLNLSSITSWTETGLSFEPEYYSLTSTTNLTVPDPNVVATYLPTAGTVKTGTNQGAATCAQPWVTIVKVPEAAQVGVNLNRDDAQQSGTFGNFSKIGIPGQQFGVGVHWYDPNAASQLLVITLRRDKCTIGSGNGTLRDAALILREKILYKPDHPTPRNPTADYRQVYLCLVTSGPYPGEPCIAFARVYGPFNLPPLSDPNRLQYLSDHEWVLFANENGRIQN